MKPAAFDLIRAESSEEIVSVLAEYGDDAIILAGGQSLLPIINMRLAKPKVIIDIGAVSELNYIDSDSGYLNVGATVTQSNLQSYLLERKTVPLVERALQFLGHEQTRNRGTVCGSIAHADPSAELPLCAKVLDSNIVLRSKRGRRIVKSRDFFTGIMQTARKFDEFVERIAIPCVAENTRYEFEEVAQRHGDFAIVALALQMSPETITLGVGGVADRPEVVRCSIGSIEKIDEFLNHFAWNLSARDDSKASAAYRRHVVRIYGRAMILGERIQ